MNSALGWGSEAGLLMLLAVDEHGAQADVAWDGAGMQLCPWMLCCIR